MTYHFIPGYPTPQHERSAQMISDFFSHQPGVAAVLLTCSCARGRASKDSCLDIAVLQSPNLPSDQRRNLEETWEVYYQTEPVFMEQRRVGVFSQVDLDFHNGIFDPQNFYHGWTSGSDAFELEVGNLIAYSHPLWEGDDTYRNLRAEWLPYYSEPLRQKRLGMVLGYCRNNLAHIPLYVERQLYFQAFKRLYYAFEEFLQALFIARRTYPISYDKWVKEQIIEILNLPDLYPRLVRMLETHQLESNEPVEKAAELERWIAEYIE
jgi:predicted nucleotidyltransferase